MRSRRARGWVAFAAGTGIAAAAPAGLAQGAWSPVSIELGPGCGSGSVLAIGSGARRLAAWSGCTESSPGAITLGTGRPGEPFRRTGELRGRIESVRPAARRGWLLTTVGSSGRGLRAVDVTAAGRVRDTTPLTDRALRFADAESTGGGTAAAAWVTVVTRRLQVRVRRPGVRRFEPPVTLSSFARDGSAGGVAVAVGPRGEIAVLWAAGASLRARIRPEGARRFGPALRVGPADTVATIAPVFTAGSRLAVIWQTADGGEEQDRPARVRVAALRAGERRFAGTLLAGDGVAREQAMFGGAHVQAVTVAGRAYVAYTGATTGVHVAELTARGTLRRVQSLDPRGVLTALSGSSTGAALVSWTHLPRTFDDPGTFPHDAQAHAAVRVPGARFGAAEAVGPEGTIVTGTVLARSGDRAALSWRDVDPAAPPRSGSSERTIP